MYLLYITPGNWLCVYHIIEQIKFMVFKMNEEKTILKAVDQNVDMYQLQIFLLTQLFCEVSKSSLSFW